MQECGKTTRMPNLKKKTTLSQYSHTLEKSACYNLKKYKSVMYIQFTYPCYSTVYILYIIYDENNYQISLSI